MSSTSSRPEDRPRWLRYGLGKTSRTSCFRLAPTGADQYPVLKPLDSYTRDDDVTTAAIASMPTWPIREQTGHRSKTAPTRYIRPVEKWKIPLLP